MFDFLFLLIFRALSGAQNGFGYAGQSVGRTLTSGLALSMLIGFYFMFHLYQAPSWSSILAITGILVSMLGIVGVEDSFNPGFNILPRDIHFWELLATGGITISFILLGGNLLAIAGSVYPGLILHKGFVNIGSGKGWWYQGTDDASGKTFKIPLLNIKVPRLSTRWRIVLAVGSVLGFHFSWAKGWSISLLEVVASF